MSLYNMNSERGGNIGHAGKNVFDISSCNQRSIATILQYPQPDSPTEM